MKEPAIIFEDDHVLVIDKPAGWIVNRADTARYQKTIQEWVEEKVKLEKNPSSESEFANRGGIVHRLDKETSGLLIVAKTEAAFTELQKQFKEGRVSKTYRALLHGRLVPEEGEINVPIGRLPWNRTRFGILPAGRGYSKTLYKVIGYYVMKEGNRKEEMTFVEAYPKTGRTHQLRVHFQYLHHPLFGDSLYAGRKNVKRDRKILDRHFLHAVTLKFTHPITGAPLELHSPLPEDLEQVISQLGK